MARSEDRLLQQVLTMSGTKRPWGVIAGPIIFVGGLAVLMGVRQAETIKGTVEGWGQQFEHSAEPVVMDLPLYVPLFVGGDWIGRLETVVVQRDRPGAVDSLQLLVHISEPGLLEDCALRIRVSGGSLRQLKRALRCVSDTEGLVSFGNLAFADGGVDVPLFVHLNDLPCDARGVHVGPCENLGGDIEAEMRALAEELRKNAGEFREEAQELRSRVRTRARGIR